MSSAGRFITFEGIEGVGKTTQVSRLSTALRAREIDHVVTREPGGTPLGDAVRAIVLDRTIAAGAAAEALLMNAARAQHVAAAIRPALEARRTVLCCCVTASFKAAS